LLQKKWDFLASHEPLFIATFFAGLFGLFKQKGVDCNRWGALYTGAAASTAGFFSSY
jgi:hypothetical protein